MTVVTQPDAKHPGKSAGGRKGAAKRWGPDGRILRLDQLDPVTREIVLSIVRARQNAAAASGHE